MMKLNEVLFGVVLVLLFLSHSVYKVSSAPLNPADKLSLLDQNGYEVISGAEEFLAPVQADNDNRLELSEGEVSKPDIFLYGKFYVLRRKGAGLKGTASMQQKLEENSAAAEMILKKIPQSSQTHVMDRFLQLSSKSSPVHKPDGNNNGDDNIFFPSDAESPKPKKYIRNRKTTLEALAFTTTSSFLPESKTLSESEQADAENLEGMSSDEVVDWAKNNLNFNDLSTILDEGFGDRTLFHLPSRDLCPEGQMKDPNGTCRRLYVHNMRRRMTRGNAKNKLNALFESWRVLEEKAVEDLQESEKEFIKKAKIISEDLQRKEKALETFVTESSVSSTSQPSTTKITTISL